MLDEVDSTIREHLVRGHPALAAAVICEEYPNHIGRIVLGLVGRADEDIVADVLVAVLQSLSNFDTNYPFRPWLNTVARRQVNKKLMKLILEREKRSPMPDGDIATGDSHASGKMLMDAEDVREVVAELGDDDRFIVYAYYNSSGAANTTAIAEALNITENALHQRVFRIKEKVRTVLMSRIHS